jgi:hypothetical protein
VACCCSILRISPLSQANASLHQGLLDLQKEIEEEKAQFRAHFASRKQ